MTFGAFSAARGSAMPIAVVSIGIFSLLAVQPVCDPGNLLDNGTTGGTVIQNQTGRDLTPDEIAQIEENANNAGVVVVLVNPSANEGPPGPVGPQGSPGPQGPPGPVYDEKDAFSVGLHSLVGEVRMWMGPTDRIPNGWILCDGRPLKQADFPRLHGLLATRFNTASTLADEFNVPDLRTRGPRGADSEDSNGRPTTFVGGNPMFVGGKMHHTLTVNQMPAHVHDISHSHTIAAGTSSVGSASVTSGSLAFPQTFSVSTHVGDSGSTGMNEPFELLDPFFSVHYIMFTGHFIGVPPPPQ